jgi:hypothetical protein
MNKVNIPQTSSSRINDDFSKHKELNKIIHLQEEFDQWEEKLLKLKLNKVKNDFEHVNTYNQIESEYQNEVRRNANLKQEIDIIKEKLGQLMHKDIQFKELLGDINEQIEQCEKQNTELFKEINTKSMYMKSVENPDNLIRHILQFNKEDLNSLCVRLNNMYNEKVKNMLMMQHNFYPPVYYNPAVHHPQNAKAYYSHGAVPVMYYPQAETNVQTELNHNNHSHDNNSNSNVNENNN